MILREISDRLLAITYDTVPEMAVTTAIEAIFDTVGVTLAGSVSGAAVNIREGFSEGSASGLSSVFGTENRVDILSAAMFNGTAAHAHDFDDCSNTMGGHPSAPLVPAIWALSERFGFSGQALIAAYIAGVEVETRLGRAVNFHHYEKGWHPTATLGVFGSAAASSHLLGLSPDETSMALGLAASMASGLKANFGTMTKAFHVGFCSRNGLSAALMAKAGVTSNAGALEHPQGFFNVFDEGMVNMGACLDDWANPLDLVQPGIAFKRHPCCASTHPAIDAILILRQKHGLKAENINSIRSWTHPRRLNHTNRPAPISGLDAKFSVQYVLARALMFGSLKLSDFTDDAVAEPSVRNIMNLVSAEPHPDSDMNSTKHFFAEVRVMTKDGQELTARVESPLGRSRDNPFPEGALELKFMNCAAPIIGDASAAILRDRLLDLQSVANIGELGPLLSQKLAS